MHRQGPLRPLATSGHIDTFVLKPDITVWHVGPDGADAGIDRVVDAKWKRLNPLAADFGVDEADAYQLLAYALRYDCTSLELAHPRPSAIESFPAPPVFKLQAAGQARDITIKVKLVPLWSPLQAEHELETADFDQAEAA